MSALVETYLQGVSTRKVTAITEELCGHTFQAATVSAATVRLEEINRRTPVVRIFPICRAVSGWCGRWRCRSMRPGPRPTRYADREQ
ncbi:transposase, partial [Mesorhizobium japonicum]|uniref:Transposase n=1 Tax=Mesorhizobium japonicum (strain LMG 29417 / CECT 9101 / MAFF 303099) TaxID=266835 RepID=Q98AH9_RHILO